MSSLLDPAVGDGDGGDGDVGENADQAGDGESLGDDGSNLGDDGGCSGDWLRKVAIDAVGADDGLTVGRIVDDGQHCCWCWCCGDYCYCCCCWCC